MGFTSRVKVRVSVLGLGWGWGLGTRDSGLHYAGVQHQNMQGKVFGDKRIYKWVVRKNITDKYQQK